MKDDELKSTLPEDELDSALAQMAEDVPPMPADFHEKWMNAVRAEAESPAPAAEGDSGGRTGSVIRWTRIFSVAAVFVFLIGGTLLYRNTKGSLSMPYAMDQRETVENGIAETPTAGAETGAETEAAAEDRGYAGEAEEADAAAEPEEFEMNTLAASNEKKASFTAAGAAATEETAEEADGTAAYEAEAVWEEAAEEPEAAAAGSMAEATAEATAAPIPEPTAEPTAALTAETAQAPAEEPGKESFLQAASAFIADMGDFLLAALPYLAVLAVPAAAAVVFSRKKRKGKEGK